mmetsp:Transcript_2798/g.8433  ORF Transcript_2798/g.8433 Transcript_2798/m.8433 type:complete len:480 (-) Transcript_2798:3-1442(-)
MLKLMTCWMSGKSSPFAATSVATSTSFSQALNCWIDSFRSSWGLPPWIAAASTPLRSKYSWTSSHSRCESQKMTTGGPDLLMHRKSSGIRRSRMTNSTSWRMLALAAPARPTLTVTGRTSELCANSTTRLGMVALKSRVWRCTRQYPRMRCSSSSKPWSATIRSPSSRQKKRHRSRLRSPRASRSLSRPGVATTMCVPCCRRSATCWRLSIPPIARVVRRRGKRESLRSASQKYSTTSSVCFMSSREGPRMTPNGPSPPMRGVLSSSPRAMSTMGSEKVSVLPLPVNAMPIMSRPLSATGRPWIWMGVGRTIPFSRRAASTQRGRRMSAKRRTGGGTSSPSTRMRSLSRMRWLSASGRERMRRSGRQPVSSEVVKRRPPLARSAAERRAFCCCTMLSSRRSSSACCRLARNSGSSCSSALISTSDLGAASPPSWPWSSAGPSGAPSAPSSSRPRLPRPAPRCCAAWRRRLRSAADTNGT